MRAITTTSGTVYRVRFSQIPLIERTATGYRRRECRVLLRQRLILIAPGVERGQRMRTARYAGELADRHAPTHPANAR